MGLEQIDDLKALDAELAKDSMKGLWVREERMNRKPTPFGKPHLWRWPKIRAGLEAAGRLVTTNYKGARRAITLVHPGLEAGTSFTLGYAVQLVKAGESVYSHRHTNAAMRFVIDGGPGVYTITEAEKCIMEPGDLVIQPSWGWHNHINETERDAIWIDCLDSGLMRMLHTTFQSLIPRKTRGSTIVARTRGCVIQVCLRRLDSRSRPWSTNGRQPAARWPKCCPRVKAAAMAGVWNIATR